MRIVLCNCSPNEAPSLARTLVEEQLAACVNLLPAVTSVYRWEGQVHEETETTLLIKTTPDALDALKARVLALHTYDLPEFVVLEPGQGSHQAYVDWVRANVGVLDA